MARATVDVSLRADIKDLVNNLNKVQGVTKKEARAMVREMKKGYDAQVKAAKIAADMQIKAQKGVSGQASKTAGHITDVMQKTATEVSSIFGIGLLGDLEGTFDIARQSSEKFGGSVAAAFTIAGAAVVAGVAVAVQALSSYVEKQRELAQAIAGSADQLAGFVDDALLAKVVEFSEHMEALEAGVLRYKAEQGLANDELLEMQEHIAALDALGAPAWFAGLTEAIDGLADSIPTAAKNLAVLIEALPGTGPNWLTAALAVGDLGESLRTQGEDTRQAKEANEEWLASIKAMADAMDAADREDQAKATQAQAEATRRLADFNRKWAESTREAEQAEQTRIDAAKALNDQISATVATQAKNIDIIDSEGAALRKLNRDYEAQVKAIGAVGLATGDTERMTKQLADASEAYRISLEAIDAKQAAAEFADISAKVNLAAQAVTQLAGAASTFAGLALDRFSELADAERERFEARVERQTEARREEVAAQLESGEISQAVADARLTALDLNEERRKKYHDALTKDQRQAAQRAFAVSQAAAVAEVLASGATAYMGLLASMSYLGFGAPAAAAAITAPAVAAQLAVIASNKPPQFADGGMVTPDHRMISAQPGEAVISRRGVAALGGPTGIESLNRGMSAGQNMTANIVLDRRIIGQAVADLVPASMTRRSGRIAIYGG